MTWSLEVFERQVYGSDLEGATRTLLDLLDTMNANYGELGEYFNLQPSLGVAAQRLQEHAVVRLCAAITTLFAHPDFALSPSGIAQTLNWHRWISALFGASDFMNADHLLRSLNTATQVDEWQIREAKLQHFCMLYSPDSGIPVNLDNIFAINSVLTVGLGLALLSPRFLGTVAAHEKREILLPWLTEKLALIESLEQLPTAILHDVYMHCSYAASPRRHEIKKPINRLVQRTLHAAGLGMKTLDRPRVPDKKPVMLVVLEWFSRGHSIYRTHSKTMASARELFEVIAIAYPHAIDEVGRSIFDRVIDLDPQLSLIEQMRKIEQIAEQECAQVLYMPSVGMFPLTVFLSNLRVCPVQAMALGHPATTHSKEIDYVVVEADYVGNPDCFSEELLILPPDGMPYRPSELLDQITPLYLQKGEGAAVDIVVCATTMKLNPRFLQTCAQIGERAKVAVHFHFLVGQANGLVYPAVKRFVTQFLGDRVTVYPHQAYGSYIDIITRADLFLNPFPFGNTNGIIDTISAGLVGICKTGDEVFEHIDQGLFERLHMPGWMITKTEEEYIEAALRLIENPQERMRLRKSLAGEKAVQVLFKGRAQILGQMLLERLSGVGSKGAIAKNPLGSKVSSRLNRSEIDVHAESIPDWLSQEVADYFAVPINIKPQLILDIGANIGAFALRAHQEWPNAKVICYEPMPFNVTALLANVNFAWCQVEPFGVRAVAGNNTFWIGDLFVSGGFQKSARSTGDTASIQCLAAATLPCADLIKIDTEGCEYEILQHLDLSKAQGIMLEHHSKEDAANIKELLKKDFKLIADQSDREVGTEVFVRKNFRGARWVW